MSDELDRRAALAMGIKRHEDYFGEYWESADGKYCEKEPPHPSTDRNDLAELLREVERRGLEFDLDRIFEFPSIAATFGLDVAKLCEAACEVLEATNERD